MSDTTKQVAFRLPTDLLERVQGYTERRKAAEPGLELSLTGAVRVLLEAGLRAEAERFPAIRGRTKAR